MLTKRQCVNVAVLYAMETRQESFTKTNTVDRERYRYGKLKEDWQVKSIDM